MNNKKVSIIGQGYVGLPLAMSAAKAGWLVTGVDSSERVVQGLNCGVSHVEDVSNEILSQNLTSGKYRASTDYNQVAESSICIIAVPTPLHQNRTPNLDFLESALRNVANSLPANVTLISESTSFPGTTREFIIPLIRSLREDHAISMSFAAAPERIDPKNQKWTLNNTPRIIGGIDSKSTEKARMFYDSICSQVLTVPSLEVAEMSKLLENTFRQVNIALINQLAVFCNQLGIDIHEVIQAADTKPYGFMKFFPGAGVGGHCIPIDPMYLYWRAKQLSFDFSIIKESDKVNGSMPKYVVDRFIESARLVPGSTVVILGVSYKPGLADTRESPAKSVAFELKKFGCTVLWSDPIVESFQDLKRFSSERLDGAIIVTAQKELLVEPLIKQGIPVFDCTGVFKHLVGMKSL